MSRYSYEELEKQKADRLGEEKVNNQGCLMKITEYSKADDIIVEFQDNYKYRVRTRYNTFLKGKIKNPYYASVYFIGIIGVKYPTKANGKMTKEYKTWFEMLRRCFNEKFKEKHPTYKDVTCCEEWIFYENFYEWLHKQENFEKWCNNTFGALDKDILIKGNKIYSPETCCLVPINVNTLFVINHKTRGKLPIGVTYFKDRKKRKYCASTHQKTIGYYETPEQAFYAYKKYKENLIKQVAQAEHDNNNISNKCYEAMMNYEVEIDD